MRHLKTKPKIASKNVELVSTKHNYIKRNKDGSISSPKKVLKGLSPPDKMKSS